MPIITIRLNVQDQDGNAVHAPGAFAQSGPLLEVLLVPPEGMASDPVRGYAMIDTGASVSCVNAETAEAAGWPIIDTAKMSSTTHTSQDVPVFAGRLLSKDLNDGHIHVPRWMGVKLDSEASLFPLVALIGRDLLQTSVFIYNGQDQSFTLAIP